MATTPVSSSTLRSDSVSIVKVRGRNPVWPDRCVGCGRTSSLVHRELSLHAQDGGLNKRELESTEPARTIMTWNYPICRLCSTESPHLSHAWYVGDATATVIAGAAILATTIGGASGLWILAVAIMLALYAAIRFAFLYRFKSYLASLPHRNEKGAFVRCIQVVGLDHRPIRGFDNFVELLRRGDVICEFEFRNGVIAEEFRRLNASA